MPYYEYQCQTCGHKLEAMQRITDDPLRTCPSCGGKLNKLISNTSFILKGTGWYATDYAKKSMSPKPEKPSKDKTESKKPESTASSKKED